MKKILLILISAVFAFSFSGCSKDKDSKKKVVGVLLRNDYDAFFVAYKSGLIEAAQQDGISLQIYSANNDAAIQIDQMKTLLLNGVKNFVIVAHSTDLTEQMAKIISSQGGSAAFSNIIPSIDALRVGKNFFYASSPETDAGNFQAQIIDDYFKKNPGKLSGKKLKVIYFNGEYGHPAQIYRKVGVMEGLAKLGYDVEVIAEYGANWDRSSARQYLDLFIEGKGKKEKFDVVIAQNDEMALGAVDSLVNHGYVDNPSNPTLDADNDGTALRVPVLGIDATEGGKKSMRDNQMYGTVLQDANAQAETALELVYQCMKNGSAQGYTTKAGLRSASQVTKEAPLTERSVIDQCFVVPFVPVKK
ncbi:MAG: substrate-binding domain-containing protein [Treponema sp.]|nr:substrate-binding domain-containing protein [Treponema sp.]